MSRIHEALKKAAQERTAQLAAGGETSFVELAEGPRTVPPAREMEEGAMPTLPPMAQSGAAALKSSTALTYLRYEELIKQCATPKWRIDPRLSVFEGGDEAQVGAERFRTLRSRLYQIAGTRPLRRVVVTSSVPAEGKTFVASNLAQSIVRQPDRRVLLIDADLRASRLHQTLGAPSGPGLSDYLRGELDEYAVIQNGLEGNLCFIPGGQQVSNPSELLLGEKMKHLLDTMSE